MTPGIFTGPGEIAERTDGIPIGLLYQNTSAPRYDEYGAHNLGMNISDKAAALEAMLDPYTIKSDAI